MKYCKQCHSEINKVNTFCDSSCAAKYNNSIRLDKCPNKNKTKVAHCIICGSQQTINLRASDKSFKCDDCKMGCYFCKRPAIIKLGSGKICCQDSPNKCPAIRIKNSESNKIRTKLNGPNHVFTDSERAKSNLGKIENAKKDSFGDSILNLSENAKKYLTIERGSKCECCGIIEWNNKPITFEVDHIDGNRHNNVKTNLQVLCPNCHSQTENWRGRNLTNGTRKHTIELILTTFNECKNIHKTLIALNLAPKGGNYSTIKKILIDNGINYKNASVS